MSGPWAEGRITAYTSPAENGDGVVVDVEGMMLDLVTFIKAAAINNVTPEVAAKAQFFVALDEVWKNVEVTCSQGASKQN